MAKSQEPIAVVVLEALERIGLSLLCFCRAIRDRQPRLQLNHNKVNKYNQIWFGHVIQSGFEIYQI